MWSWIDNIYFSNKIQKDVKLIIISGFGFVAGSEKPVVIRSVIPGKSKWVCKWRAIAIIVFIPPHLRTNLKGTA